MSTKKRYFGLTPKQENASKTVKLEVLNGRLMLQIPDEFGYDDVTEVIISKRQDTLTLDPVRRKWTSFVMTLPAEPDFLASRPDIVDEREDK